MISSSSLTLPFRLTICGIPELNAHCASGVTHVLSLLDPEFEDTPVFAAFGPHHRLALHFHDIIDQRPHCHAPQRAHVERLLAFGRELIDAPDAHLLIHCHAGVSRSTASAALLLAQAWPYRPASAALEVVSDIRPGAWPNLRILEFGDALLGRRGEIVAAVPAIYRRVLERDPCFEEALLKAGRFREIMTARANEPSAPSNLMHSLMQKGCAGEDTGGGWCKSWCGPRSMFAALGSGSRTGSGARRKPGLLLRVLFRAKDR
jgi:predicted protein tyrosine phosphatase